MSNLNTVYLYNIGLNLIGKDWVARSSMQTSTPHNVLWQFQCKEERLIAIDDLEPLPYKSIGVESTVDETLYLSIRSIGLQDPFVVASPTNSSKYTLIAGGNSRLQALGQLWAETEDERFTRAPCLIAEWPGKFRACLAHIITNDVRISSSFLERAQSLTHIVETHGNSAKGRASSQRDAVALLNDNGYSISQAAYGYMVYLVTRLVPLLANELLEQLGLVDVRQIRELENTLNEQSCRKGIPGHEFTDMFNCALKLTDISIWEFDRFRTQVEEIVSSRVSTGQERLLGSAQIKRHVAATEFPQNGTIAKTNLAKVERGHFPNGQHEVCEDLDSGKDNTAAGIASKPDLPNSVDAFELTSSTVRHLRNSSYELAVKLCEGLSIDDVCVEKSHMGCGFKLDTSALTELEPLQQESLAYLDVFSAIADPSDPVASFRELTIDSTTPHEVKRGAPTTEQPPILGQRQVCAGLWVELEDHNWHTLMELWGVVRLLQSKQEMQST